VEIQGTVNPTWRALSKVAGGARRRPRAANGLTGATGLAVRAFGSMSGPSLDQLCGTVGGGEALGHHAAPADGDQRHRLIRDGRTVPVQGSQISNDERSSHLIEPRNSRVFATGARSAPTMSISTLLERVQ